jgi:hypothetical protein
MKMLFRKGHFEEVLGGASLPVPHQTRQSAGKPFVPHDLPGVVTFPEFPASRLLCQVFYLDTQIQ